MGSRPLLPILLSLTIVAGCVPAPRPTTDGPPPAGDHPPPASLEPRNEPLAATGNPPWYEVDGRRYHVLPTAEGYVAQGIASWYGMKFHGRPTSSGEPYDVHALTAAHRTLPLPSYVRVTHLATGNSVVVRVNDRGPFVEGRLIDLSWAAARELGMVDQGTAEVEVRALGQSAVEGRWFIQAGAFAERRNARRLARRLADLLATDLQIVPLRRAGKTLWKVRVGPLASLERARELGRRLEAAGHADFQVVVEPELSGQAGQEPPGRPVSAADGSSPG
ncbi:MAG TPA: septal ring lytic transglycosylase RlpA family protein [Thiotrichales bacterium]|nr:septal ring lytic transglycosylase RlpA family protein [Thiotrichales bacterium]